VIADTHGRAAAAGAHADALLTLELLALGLQGRRHHQLGAVELRDVAVAAGGHRSAQAAHQVERAVVLAGRTGDDLLEGAVLLGRHSGATRQGRVERRHPPVVATAGRLISACQRRAEHYGVGAAGDRLGDVAAIAHPAVGDHLHVVAGLEHVLRTRRGHVGDRGGLGHADAEHAARGADRSRPDADEHARRARAHEVKALIARDVLRRDDRALDHQDVETRLECDVVVGADLLRGQRGRRDDSV